MVTWWPAAGEEERGLAGGIAAANYHHRCARRHVVPQRLRGVEDAKPAEPVEPARLDSAIADPSSDDHAVRRDNVAAVEVDKVGRLVAGAVSRQPDRGHGQDDRRPEAKSLEERSLRELVAADPDRETQVVLDPGCNSDLAADREAFHQGCGQPFGRAVHRRGEPGRTGADDRDVVRHARCRAGADAGGTREFLVGRPGEHLAAAHDHDGRLVARRLVTVQDGVGGRIAIGIEPDMRESVAYRELEQAAGVR
jgi:hypothetical protein